MLNSDESLDLFRSPVVSGHFTARFRPERKATDQDDQVQNRNYEYYSTGIHTTLRVNMLLTPQPVNQEWQKVWPLLIWLRVWTMHLRCSHDPRARIRSQQRFTVTLICWEIPFLVGLGHGQRSVCEYVADVAERPNGWLCCTTEEDGGRYFTTYGWRASTR